MAQQNINIGTADAKQGDTYFDAFTKAEANFTELYAGLQAQPNNVVVINQESDFPTQDATTITLEADTQYFIGTAFSTAKTFTVENGASMTSINPFSTVVTYTGIGTMFNAVGVSFEVNNINISASTGTIFNYTGPGVMFVADVRVASCAGMGTATASGPSTSVVVNNSAILSNSGNGLDFVGAFRLLSILQLFQIGTSGSHVGLDLGTATFENVEMSNLQFSGPSGSVGLSGAASSANIATGVIATVDNSTLNGNAMTSLSGITNSDIRWKFTGNSGIADTLIDALVSITGNTTQTAISAANTPVKAAATFVVEDESKYTCDTSGTCTYDGEVDDRPPVGISITVDVASGTNKDITAYLAKNGAVITNSGMKTTVNSGRLESIVILWQENTSENDFYEIWVENNTDTTNIIVTDGTLRIR
jgi:hypothetical protein